MSRPVIIASLLDIQQVLPHFNLEYLETHKSEVRVFLRNMGFDSDFGVEIQEGLQHRSKFCGIVTCPRLVGIERVDRDWLQSGNASYEACMHSDDKTLSMEISKLKKSKFAINLNKESE